MNENQPWRTFPIFISSTFADMQAERDYLKHIVFPRVEEELQKRRIKLEMVDLRWGVDTISMEQEDEREASVLKVCLEEIKRCRPFFIGLLGDRYGWVPTEERMKNALLGIDEIGIDGTIVKTKGTVEDEIEKKPEHQKGLLGFFKKNKSTPKKYPNSYVRNLSSLKKSVTALEIEFGVLASKDHLSRSVFYFRDPLPYETFPAKRAAMYSDAHNPDLSETEKQERKTALQNLKTSIKEFYTKRNLANKVKTYQGNWDKSIEKVSGLEAWGEMVYEDILEECRLHAEETWDKVPQNWKEQELALLDAFVEEHTTSFCGRAELLAEIERHLLSPKKENWGLVLTDESGSGKSSVFAMVKKAMDKEDCFVLAHSAGLSPHAKSVYDLLQIWNTQLSNRLGIEENEEADFDTPENLQLDPEAVKGKTAKPEIEKIKEKFRELLFTLAEQQQVVLLVDALDRFEPTECAKFMTWLPTVMPGNIRLLCTAITGTEKDALQYHSSLFVKNLDYFTGEEARKMLNMLCLKQHKTLPKKVEITILDKRRDDGKPATSSPLWLSLAVNMLMALDHDDFEKMTRLEGRGDQQIETYMAGMAQEFAPLPGTLFLSLVNKTGTVFGEEFTKAVFNYVACSRNGLREKDLEKLLPEKTWDPLQFAGLRRWFKAHLVLQGEELQWNLAHSILRKALLKVTGETQSKIMNSNLATYLLTLVDDSLKTTETLYHLLQARKLKEAAIYYGGELTAEEITGATTSLAETLTSNEKGIEIASSLPSLVSEQPEIIHRLLIRYIHYLDSFLAKEGNLNSRLNLLNRFWGILKKTFGTNFPSEEFASNTGLLIEQLGHLYDQTGNYSKALDFYNDGISLLGGLSKTNSENKPLKINYAISLHRLGIYYQQHNDYDKSLEYFNNEVLILEELQSNSPKNELYKFKLAICYGSLSNYYLVIMNLNQALEYGIRENKLLKELYRSNYKDNNFKDALVSSYTDLGIIYMQLGKFEQARQFCKSGINLIEELYKNEPKNQRWKKGLAILYSFLGMIYIELEKFDLALEFYIKDNLQTKDLYKLNPEDRALKEALATSHDQIAALYEKIGDFAKALEYYNKKELLIKELYDNNIKDEFTERSLYNTYVKIGEIYKELKNLDKALEYYILKNVLLKELYERKHKDSKTKVELAISFSDVGDMYRKTGNLEQALEYYNNYHGLIKELYEINKKEKTHLKVLAASFEMLGTTYLSLDKLDQALALINEADEFFGVNGLTENLVIFIIRHKLTLAFAKTGNLRNAIKSVLHAIKFHPEWSQWHYELIETIVKSSNETEIHKIIEKLVSSELENIGLLYVFGMLYQTLGMQEKAITFYRKGIGREPKNAVLYYNLGNSHNILGDKESCIQYQLKAIAYSSTLAEPHYVLGFMYMKSNKLEEAKKHFETFLKLGKPYLSKYIENARFYLNNMSDNTKVE